MKSWLYAIILWPSLVFAQTAGGWVDPNALPSPPSGAQLNVYTNGLAVRSQTINTAIKNLVLIVAGQSNVTDVAPSAFSPVNASAIDVMNTSDGGVYAAVDPLVGCSLTFSGGNPLLRLADAYITAGNFARVILVPIGIGGSSVADWATGNSVNRIQVAMQRLAAKGFTAQTNVTIAIFWGQGETDNTLGTSQASYTASLNTVISNASAAGFTGRWFIAEQSWNGSAVSTNVQNAQIAAVSGSVFSGGDADTIINSTCSGSACRQATDPNGNHNLHWSDLGSAAYAAAIKTAMAASGAPF